MFTDQWISSFGKYLLQSFLLIDLKEVFIYSDSYMWLKFILLCDSFCDHSLDGVCR